jgi:hypothetical protein
MRRSRYKWVNCSMGDEGALAAHYPSPFLRSAKDFSYRRFGVFLDFLVLTARTV